MSVFVSNPIVNLEDKFILSFNVVFSTKSEAIGFGIDSVKRRSTTVTDIDTFFSKINRGIVIDNGTSLLDYSSKYQTDGTYVWNKDPSNNTILDLELKINREKVYEEVKDITSYDPKVDTDIYVTNKKLFKYIPNRYIIDNDVIKLNFSQIQLTSIFSFENNKLKVEEYHIQDNLQTFNNKLRFLLTNGGTTLNLSKFVDDGYEQIGSYFFSEKEQNSRIYLFLENTKPNNISVTYKE